MEIIDVRKGRASSGGIHQRHALVLVPGSESTTTGPNLCGDSIADTFNVYLEDILEDLWIKLKDLILNDLMNLIS